MRIHRFETFGVNEDDEEKKVGLSEELKKKISETIKHAPDAEFYWDYRDEMSAEMVGKIIEKGDSSEVENEIWDMNIDNIIDLENDQIKDAFEEHGDEVAKELGEDKGEIDFADLAREYREEFLDDVHVDLAIKDLAKNTGDIPARVSLYSNYEGLQSNFDMTQGDGGYGYEKDQSDYFSQMVDALNLNPAKVKEALEKDNINTVGEFPNIEERNGQEYVRYSDLANELANNSSLCQLTFACKINVKSLVESEGEGALRKFLVPAGNDCGLFSSWVGGGSLMEMKLLKDFPIDLDKQGESEYDKYELFVDEAKKYSIKSVYGVSNDFFGKPISFKK